MLAPVVLTARDPLAGTAPVVDIDAPPSGGHRPPPVTLPGTFADAPGPLIAAVIGAAYFAVAQYVIWLNDPVNAGAGYWPAAGLTLVALLVLPVRRWGWVIGAIVVAELGGDAVHGYPLSASSWWAVGNAAEPVVAAIVLRRFGQDARLAPLPNLVRFLGAGVVLGPLVGAVIGSLGTSSTYGTPYLEVLVKWWAGDGLGVLVVAPLLLCLREPSVPGRPSSEVVVTVALAAVVPTAAFHNWNPDWDVVLPYLIFPFLMWASVRLGIRGAAIAGFVVAEVANLTTALGSGPFDLIAGSDRHAVTVLQVFIGSALIASLVIATLVQDALDRTRQYERQRSIAEALQDAVVPGRLPSAAGLEIAAGYAAASTDAAVHIGGDWYDVFEIGDGSTALVVGDVTGHDLGAAVLMSQLRNGLRSLLVELRDPSQVMQALDRQLAATTETALATAIIAVHRSGELRWTNAGHPPLLLAPVDGPARYLSGGTGRILGLGDSSYETACAALHDGDIVVAFTDGVIEHRSWSLDEAFTQLAGLAARTAAAGPQAVCDIALAEGLGGRRRDDDACVLAARRCSGTPSTPRARPLR